jgi:hypothetical protein
VVAASANWLCSSLAVVCSDAQERPKLSSTGSTAAPKAQTVAATKPEKNPAPKSVTDKAAVPPPTDSLSIASKNNALPESKAPAAVPLPKADSKMTSLNETKSNHPLSAAQPAALTTTAVSVDIPKILAATAAPKIESKRSTAVVIPSLPQEASQISSSDPLIASAASPVCMPALSPRAERRRRQKEHKGAASDELLLDYQAVLAKRGPDRPFEAQHDLLVSQQVQSCKSRGADLVGVLKQLWHGPGSNFCAAPTFFGSGVFSRELINVAFHANSVDQAFKRTVDFRARVGKLASLRSADR